jgi:hypothetical protein
MSSGTHYDLRGINYLELYGEEPSAIEQAYAIYANIIEIDENGIVLNAKYAQKRAAQYIRSYCDKTYKIEPPFESWELELHEPPSLKNLK